MPLRNICINFVDRQKPKAIYCIHTAMKNSDIAFHSCEKDLQIDIREKHKCPCMPTPKIHLKAFV